MSKEDFLQWLREHPFITLSRLERGANIPLGTLKKAIANQQEIPDKHVQALINEVKKYGYDK